MINVPPYALWILLIAALGWLIPHLLKVSRDDRAKRKADQKVSLLSDAEHEVLRHCVATSGFEKGHVWIMRVDVYGSWVRAGKHDFVDQADPTVQARYLDAFESLLGRGYFRHEGGMLYQLTGVGFRKAQNDT